MVKQCAMPVFFFLITVCISLIIPNTEWCVPYRSHEFILDIPLSSYSMLAWSVAMWSIHTQIFLCLHVHVDSVL